MKISQQMQDEIEDLMANPEKITLSSPDKIGKAVRLDDASGRYTEFCKIQHELLYFFSTDHENKKSGNYK